jgi:D-beta-D-heptose 7-phosphate kinase/D-beta-D-heptose 1-phosphate adenosyltransferase
MFASIPNFSTAHVLVIGDVMLDRYWHGTTSRISPEAPVPIVHVQQQQERPGGAGNVALNISALGAETTLIGVTGQDEAADKIQQHLQTHGTHCALIQLKAVPTVTKLRVLSRHQQLIRLDFEQTHIPLDSEQILATMLAHLPKTKAVILSDYGKGTLTDPQSLIQAAHQADIPILIDPKGTDFTKYRGATLITPNRNEFEAVVGACQTEQILVEKGEILRESLELEALLITRSEQGMTLIRKGYEALHLPAHAREVFDVTGAGDTVIGVLASCLAAGEDLVSATALANIAAGLVVGKLGAETVTIAELQYALHTQENRGIYDVNSLKTVVQTAQANGENIVMTNGCFDILHAGHVQYLRQARQLGERLIVAVNDDESVKRLKGQSRPINTLEQRMTVLNALECVDWVIPFSQDTPEQLICALLPDILVKGGDYKIQDIAGGDCVMQNGGKVLVLDFLQGVSTTNTIQRIQTKDVT